MLQKEEETQYKEIYTQTKPIIEEFKSKSGLPQSSDIEVCLNGLYALMLLRLQNKDVSNATAEALAHFSKFLAILSQKFRMFEEGKGEV